MTLQNAFDISLLALHPQVNHSPINASSDMRRKKKRPIGRFVCLRIYSSIQLHMDGMPFSIMGGFHQCLTQGGMRVDIPGDLSRRELHHLRQGQLG